MNFANMLTTVRIVIVPFFVALLKFNSSQFCRIAALLLFLIASVTDAFDGIIARKFNLISNFGKFFDPLADKILTVSAMICLIELHLMSSIFLIIIVTREFLITSIRLAANLHGKIIAANFLGKLKTILQIVAIALLLFKHAFEINSVFLNFISYFTLIIATFLTIISGAHYFIKNIKFIN